MAYMNSSFLVLADAVVVEIRHIKLQVKKRRNFIMKNVKKKMNNKGFSLVELIIVVAIMAVLGAVLVPTYITFVETSKISTDIDNAQAIASAIAIQATTDSTLLDVTAISAIPSTVTTPTVQLDSTYTFKYDVDANDNLRIYVSKSGATPENVQLYPSVTSGSAWDN